MKRLFTRRRCEKLEQRRFLDAAGGFSAIDLASNVPNHALLADSALVNPWGLALGPNTPLSVSDNLAAQATSYAGDVNGSALGEADRSVRVPLPTAQVYNNTTDFIIGRGNGSLSPASAAPVAPAQFLYASLNGQIYASNSLTGDQAVAVVTRSPSATSVFNGPVFTGLAIDNNGLANYLYAADYLGGKIDVFDGQFKSATLAGAFSDPNLPDGYLPFNIQNIGGELYVTYAHQLRPPGALPGGSNSGGAADATATSGSLDVSGGDGAILNAVRPLLPHGGVIDVYDANGHLLRRLAAGDPLNGPWGMALAPADFGSFGGDLLVGNYADGKINAFDPTSGAWLGALSDAAGQAITEPGLWGLAFGNGTQAGDPNTLFFAAGLNFFGRPLPPGPTTAGANADSSTTGYVLPTFEGRLGAIQPPDSGPISAVAATLSAVEGFTFAGPVAAFGSTQPPLPLANPLPDFTATIDWSDGTMSPGLIRSTGNGGYLVDGKHVYKEEGTQVYTVVVKDRLGDQTTATGTINVHDAPLVAVGLPVSVSTSTSVTNARLAVFADLGGAEPTANYSATMDWGDGTPPSTGTITAATANDDLKAASLWPAATAAASISAVPPQRFAVTGDHEYSAPGSYWATITLVDEGGSTVKVRSLIVVGAPNNAFIEQAFRDILHRDVDAAGLAYWQSQLADGLARGDLATALTHSAEYFANVIRPDYEKFLGRAADTQGLNYWIGRMQQGLSDQQLAAGFAASAEFYASSGGADAGWLSALYQSLLNRTVDAQGSVYWLSQLAGGVNRQTIADRFTNSSEQTTNQLSDDYFNLLGRAPSITELGYWLNAMQHGASNEQVLAAFVASPEYYQKA